MDRIEQTIDFGLHYSVKCCDNMKTFSDILFELWISIDSCCSQTTFVFKTDWIIHKYIYFFNSWMICEKSRKKERIETLTKLVYGINDRLKIVLCVIWMKTFRETRWIHDRMSTKGKQTNWKQL